MKPMTVGMMEKVMTKCDTPNCTHDHSVLYLRPRCHPDAGLDVRYERGSGVVNVSCRKCKALVMDIGVALA